MGYNVVLDLTPEQKKRLKLTATEANQSVRGFVTELVVRAITPDGAKPTKSLGKK